MPKVFVSGAANYNHGCQDFLVAEYEGEGRARITEVDNCNSCWQVGHDRDHIHAVVGDLFELSTEEIMELEAGRDVHIG